jgi:hypothetical protein
MKSCPCGSRKPRRELNDARGIFCCYVCDKCVTEKRRKYRSDIFINPNYVTVEPIEEEDDQPIASEDKVIMLYPKR